MDQVEEVKQLVINQVMQFTQVKVSDIDTATTTTITDTIHSPPFLTKDQNFADSKSNWTPSSKISNLKKLTSIHSKKKWIKN